MTGRCEDAPCCGHPECGFGPGVPGYGSRVGGVPYYGEPKLDAFGLPAGEWDDVPRAGAIDRAVLEILLGCDECGGDHATGWCPTPDRRSDDGT